MFCAKRTFQKGRETCCNVRGKDYRLSNFYVGSPIEQFLCVVNKAPHSVSKSFRLTSDIYMLFNQQRLDRLTQQALVQHFNDLAVRDNTFASLKSKLTDDQLISVVKSRFIQSPSELLSWSRYLNTLADDKLQAYLSSLPESEPVSSDPAPADPVPSDSALPSK